MICAENENAALGRVLGRVLEVDAFEFQNFKVRSKSKFVILLKETISFVTRRENDVLHVQIRESEKNSQSSSLQGIGALVGEPLSLSLSLSLSEYDRLCRTTD